MTNQEKMERLENIAAYAAEIDPSGDLNVEAGLAITRWCVTTAREYMASGQDIPSDWIARAEDALASASYWANPTKLVNLTPHPVVILDNEDNYVLSILPWGTVARVEQAREQVDRLYLGGGVHVSMYANTFGEVKDLPLPAPSIKYIVSALVARAASHRDDLLVPDDIVRGESGKIKGCRGFLTFYEPPAP